MSDEELQILVEKISLEFFHKPFRHRASFNLRLKTTGGRYLLKTHNIEVNKKYFEQLGLGELIGIIKHELCHYHLHIEGKGYKHRDTEFKLLLKEVEGSRYCSALPESTKKRLESSIIYYCSKCGQVYERKRMINTKKYVCGSCRGRLVLKS